MAAAPMSNSRGLLWPPVLCQTCHALEGQVGTFAATVTGTAYRLRMLARRPNDTAIAQALAADALPPRTYMLQAVSAWQHTQKRTVVDCTAAETSVAHLAVRMHMQAQSIGLSTRNTDLAQRPCSLDA